MRQGTVGLAEARTLAAQYGLELVAFAGGNLAINSGTGAFEVRALIDGNRVYARADHPFFSLMQLLKHEIGHHKVRKGNVDIKKVYKAIVDAAMEEYVEYVIANYVAAYSSLEGYGADYILEEILCDYQAGMNIFSEKEVPASFWEMAEDILQSEDVKTDAARGPPADGDAKFSRANRGRSIELETKENNRFQRLRQFHGDLPEQWYAYTRDFFYIYSNQSYMDYTILAKISITSKNRDAINDFTEALENGTYEHSKTFDSWTSHFRRGKGRYRWDSIRHGDRGTTVPPDGVDEREPGRNYSGYTEKGGRTGLTEETGRKNGGRFSREFVQTQRADGVIVDRLPKEVIPYGQKGRAEDHASFLRRMHESARRVKQVGGIAYAFYELRVLDASNAAAEARRELRRLGIKCFLHNGLEYNVGGYTYQDMGVSAALADGSVAVYGKSYGDGVEYAGHEAFHVWKNSPERAAYVDVLRENINIVTSVYGIQMADTVLKKYFDGDLSALQNTDAKAWFIEELYALVSGQLHSGAHMANHRSIGGYSLRRLPVNIAIAHPAKNAQIPS